MAVELAAIGLGCARGERNLFESLNFSLSSGGLLALAGPNGAGKTSLLRLLAGLLPPAAGTVRIVTDSGAAEDGESRRMLVGWFGVEEALKPQTSLRTQLYFHAALYGGGDVEVALMRCGLAAIANRPARLLSSGQRRRAALARLMLCIRPVWLLDEPLASLDEDGRALLRAALTAHGERGGVAVIAGHDPVGLPCATLMLEGGCARFSP